MENHPVWCIPQRNPMKMLSFESCTVKNHKMCVKEENFENPVLTFLFPKINANSAMKELGT